MVLFDLAAVTLTSSTALGMQGHRKAVSHPELG